MTQRGDICGSLLAGDGDGSAKRRGGGSDCDADAAAITSLRYKRLLTSRSQIEMFRDQFLLMLKAVNDALC